MTLLLASALKSCLLLVPALGMAPLVRAAALRHAMVAAAIACAAAIPILSVILPHWGAAVILGDATTIMSAGWLAAVRPWLAVVWATGALVGLGITARRVLRLVALHRRCDEITDRAWTDLALDIAAEYRVPRPVTLFRSDAGSLLGTWGLDPKVVLPRQSDTWDHARRVVVLRHELAHVRRRDWLVQTAAEIVRAAYWFNPLIWIACRRLREESEHACDADVIRAGVDARDYAAHLVEIARVLRPQRAWWPAVAMTHESTLARRVRMILWAPRAMTAPRTRRIVTIAMAAFTVALAIVGAPSQPRRIVIPSPRAQKLTLMLDGQIVDLSRGWPPSPDNNAGLVAGHGQRLTVQTNR